MERAGGLRFIEGYVSEEKLSSYSRDENSAGFRGRSEMPQTDREQATFNWSALSPREREVMLLAAKGFANKSIAQKLNVAEGTVKIHLHRTYQKLGIKSRFTLAFLANKLPPEPAANHDESFDAA